MHYSKYKDLDSGNTAAGKVYTSITERRHHSDNIKTAGNGKELKLISVCRLYISCVLTVFMHTGFRNISAY